MADDKDTNVDDNRKDSRDTKDDLDKQIDLERKRQEAMKNTKDDDPDVKKESKTKDSEDEKTKLDEDGKLTVDRKYITQLREEAKKNRLEFENLQKETQQIQEVLKKQFNVDSAQKLVEKLDEMSKSKEKEEEGKLNKLELAERRALKVEKELEQEKIRYEQKISELIKERDDMIIQHHLIQSAVANDVANPKQLLRLLKDEFYVDPKQLVPLYKADNTMSLNEFVKGYLEQSENWNLVRSKIKEGSGTTGSVSGAGKVKFTKDQLTKMRNENPEEYKRRQPEILKAYAEGNVS